MKPLLFCLFIFFSLFSFSQIDFQSVYQAHPKLPKGILEAVAYTETRITNIDNNTLSSCTEMPLPYGVMGLFDDGKNYFKENGKLVATLSQITVQQQKSSVQQQVEAYAIAFEKLYTHKSLKLASNGHKILNTLNQLSYIPDSGWINFYARDAQQFEVFKFLNDIEKANEYAFDVYQFDLKEIFGKDNLKILNGKKNSLTENGIFNEKNENYTPNTTKSSQYGPAIWTPAPTCNYSSRSGTAVSAITIHTIQGTYAGAISWSQNCSSSVSYHYVIRSSDGQITQMVDEANKAWHVGSENPYTIGYEHEGYIDNPAWYTNAMYNASANLSIDITNSGYGIPALRTYYGASSTGTNVLGGCTKIKGHQHYPNQSHTDPGINWNWEKYYRLINNNPTITSITNTNGTLTDTGGSGSNYADDERLLWLIEPINVSSITLNFTQFNLEMNYDKLFIYDGATIDAPLIGVYTGSNSPGTINSTGATILLEFRSDCATTSNGWIANYTSQSNDNQQPSTSILNANTWKTSDFDVEFVDIDNIGVIGKYYLVADKNPQTNKWSSDGNYGFCNEQFSVDETLWTDLTGSFNINAQGQLSMTDSSIQNSNSTYQLTQTNNAAYLYEWNQIFTSSEINQRAGIHFFCSDASLPNRGNSYLVIFRENTDKVQIYRVSNDTLYPKTDDNLIVNTDSLYTYRVTFNPQTGWIKVYEGNHLVSQWQDINPFQSGNSISMRSGGTAVAFDNIRVYQSRSNLATVSVGLNGLAKFQSENAIPTCAVRSMVVDEVGNWSNGVSETFLIDWSYPELNYLFDGTGNDIDTTFSNTIYANWSSEDLHSAIQQYEVAIGTLPNLNNILDWNNVNISSTFSHLLSNPIYDQVYSIALKIKNGAGLESLYVSDGQRVFDPTTVGESKLALEQVKIYPIPSNDFIFLQNVNEQMHIEIFDMQGKSILKTKNCSNINISTFSQGNYHLCISLNGVFKLIKIQKL